MRNEYSGIDLSSGALVLNREGVANVSSLTKSTFNILSFPKNELQIPQGFFSLVSKNAGGIPALEPIMQAAKGNTNEIKEHLQELNDVLTNSPEMRSAKTVNLILRKHSYANNEIGNFSETFIFAHNPENDKLLPLTRIVAPESGGDVEFAPLRTPVEGVKTWMNSFNNFQKQNETIRISNDLKISENIYETKLDRIEASKLKFIQSKTKPEFNNRDANEEDFNLVSNIEKRMAVTLETMEKQSSTANNNFVFNPATIENDILTLTSGKSMKGMPKVGTPDFKLTIKSRIAMVEQNREEEKIRGMFASIYNRDNADIAQKISTGDLNPEHLNSHNGYAMNLAAYTGNMEGLQILLQNGGNVNALDPQRVHDPVMAEYIKSEQEKKNNPIKASLQGVF